MKPSEVIIGALMGISFFVGSVITLGKFTKTTHADKVKKDEDTGRNR